MVAFLDYLPRGSTLTDDVWRGRHRFLQWVLLGHLPALLAFGLVRGYTPADCLEAAAAPAALLLLSRTLRSRRLAGLAVTAGLAACSASLVVLSGGSIEAHFHFFITIGFIALYQDWVPFLWNIVFTVLSHGIGSWLLPTAFFTHGAGQGRPWTWSLIHGAAVLAACVGVGLFVRVTENDQRRALALRSELADSNRRRFTADLLVNLARRNQNLIYRQLDLLNRLEEHERDAEQLSHLFQLDHLATRIRRNAESLLVLSGEEPARKWGRSVLLVDVVRAAIAEIEELDRVDFSVDESLAVSGRAVADCTHLLAELIENAVHFSPPGLSVMVRTRPYLPQAGAQVLTIEDWGVGMTPADLADANDLLSRPRDVDLATSQRLGLHVVARLAARYGITTALEATPGGGVTAVVVLPAVLFAEREAPQPAAGAGPPRTPVGAGVGRAAAIGSGPAGATRWPGAPGTPGGPGGPSGPDGPSGPSGPDDTDAPGEFRPYVNGAGPFETATPHLNGVGLHGPGLNGSGLHGTGLNGTGLTGTGPTGAGPTGSSVVELDDPGLDGIGPQAYANGAGTLPPVEETRRTGWTDRPEWSSWWPLPGPTAPAPPPVPGSPIAPLPPVPPFDADPGRSGRPGPPDPLAPRSPLDPLGPGRADPAGPTGPTGPAGPTDLAGPDDLGLARRTPQASLADELRRTGDPAPRAAAPAERDPDRARAALSRFQASQREARAEERRRTEGELP